MVRAAAVAGRQVSHELLAEATGLPPAALDAAVREAVDAHLLIAQPANGYGFRHALLAEAVYDDLLPGERQRLHAAYAAALTRTGAGTAAELARHARGSQDLATAFDASRRAGAEAMALAAPWEAMQHYEAALELQKHAPPDQLAGGGLAELIADAAEAMIAAGYPHRAAALLESTRDELPEDTPPERRAPPAPPARERRAQHGGRRRRLRGDLGGVAARPRRPAERRTGPDRRPARPDQPGLRPHQRGRGGGRRRRGRPAEATGAADAAADAATTLAVLQRQAGEPEAAIDRCCSAASTTRVAAGDLSAELRSRYSLGTVRFERGELPEALAEFRAGSRAGHRRRPALDALRAGEPGDGQPAGVPAR